MKRFVTIFLLAACADQHRPPPAVGEGLSNPIYVPPAPVKCLACPGGGSESRRIECAHELPEMGTNIGYEAEVNGQGSVKVTGVVGTTFKNKTYNHNDDGFANGPIDVDQDVLDQDNGGTWNMELDRTSLQATVTYKDPDTEDRTWKMTNEECFVIEQ